MNAKEEGLRVSATSCPILEGSEGTLVALRKLTTGPPEAKTGDLGGGGLWGAGSPMGLRLVVWRQPVMAGYPAGKEESEQARTFQHLCFSLYLITMSKEERELFFLHPPNSMPISLLTNHKKRREFWEMSQYLSWVAQ